MFVVLKEEDITDGNILEVQDEADNDAKFDHITEEVITEEIHVEEKLVVEDIQVGLSSEAVETDVKPETHTDNEENEEDALLDESIGIENIICEEEDNWHNSKDEQVRAAILAADWDAVECNSENLLSEVDLERV